MDFRFTEQQEAFRREVREFIKAELSTDLEAFVNPSLNGLELDVDDVWKEHQRMARRLGEKGWIALAWPREYGGRGCSHVENAIFLEEMNYARAPGIDTIALSMVAPTLIVRGSDEQKQRHLGPIAKGETFWCQGFSEPEAGSDLASVRTRAVEKEDAFYLDGQKVWTTLSFRAEWCALLARTDPEAPKHKGIGFFLVDMKSPGVTVNRLPDASGGSDLTEVFFDNVRIPKGNLVGGKTEGWSVAMTLLSFERSAAGWIGALRRLLDDTLQLAREVGAARGSSAHFRLVRLRLAEMAVEAEVSRLLAYRVAWMQDEGLNPEAEAAMNKACCTELMQNLANVGMQLSGLHGQLKRDRLRAPLGGAVEHCYTATIGPKLAGGTSEIQRNVIAQRGLSLPR